VGRHIGAGRLLCAVLLAAGTSVSLGSFAAADTRGVGDAAGDSAARLDIRSISHGHKGRNFINRISMFQSFPSSALTSMVVIVVVDTNNNIDDGAEFAIGVHWTGTALIGEVFNRQGERIGTVPVGRPDSHTVAVTLTKRLLGDIPAYSWAGGSADTACNCADVAPDADADPLLHDYTKPSIDLTSVPDPSTMTSATESFDIEFSVTDRGYSGVKSWKVLRRTVGSKRWSTVRKGSGGGDQTASIPGRQGMNYELQVVAVDVQGNVAKSPIKKVSVPLDDGNEKLAEAYATGWIEGGSAIDFMGTLHTSSLSGTTFTHEFSGSYVAWIGPGGPGTATVAIDGGDPVLVNLATFAGPRQLLFESELDRGPHEILVTALTGIVSIDAVLIR
jgi:hypothetical protein